MLLLSKHQITEEELAEVIRQVGGVVALPGATPFGGLIEGKAHVWIDPVPCYDGVFDYEDKPLDEKEFALLEEAKRMLGGEFQTWIRIALGRAPGSQRLAVRFAYLCCQRWPCVVDNHEGRLFSCAEIERLDQGGGVF